MAEVQAKIYYVLSLQRDYSSQSGAVHLNLGVSTMARQSVCLIKAESSCDLFHLTPSPAHWTPTWAKSQPLPALHWILKYGYVSLAAHEKPDSQERGEFSTSLEPQNLGSSPSSALAFLYTLEQII